MMESVTPKLEVGGSLFLIVTVTKRYDKKSTVCFER